MGDSLEVEFNKLDDIKDPLIFVVIQARYKGEWIFVRHKDRDTWEIPGGHIEEGETPDEAAKRELFEESGATSFKLTPLCEYSVLRNGVPRSGRLYFAEVEELGKVGEFEIEEIMFSDKLVENLTYKGIQSHLFEKVKSELE